MCFYENIHHRHDISDHALTLLEPHFPGQRGQWGGIAKNNLLFINLSTLFSGFYGQERRGVICHLTMASGVRCTNVFFVGVKKGFGQKFLRFWRMNLI